MCEVIIRSSCPNSQVPAQTILGLGEFSSVVIRETDGKEATVFTGSDFSQERWEQIMIVQGRIFSLPEEARERLLELKKQKGLALQTTDS